MLNPVKLHLSLESSLRSSRETSARRPSAETGDSRLQFSFNDSISIDGCSSLFNAFFHGYTHVISPSHRESFFFAPQPTRFRVRRLCFPAHCSFKDAPADRKTEERLCAARVSDSSERVSSRGLCPQPAALQHSLVIARQIQGRPSAAAAAAAAPFISFSRCAKREFCRRWRGS